jgi:hypothetical protein
MLSIKPNWNPFITARITIRANTPTAIPRIDSTGAGDFFRFRKI